MSEINKWLELVSATNHRQKCKFAECTFIGEITENSTTFKWNHFCNKHPKHPVLEHDPQKKKLKTGDDSNATPLKQPKVDLIR
jgi:hypothetical protein